MTGAVEAEGNVEGVHGAGDKACCAHGAKGPGYASPLEAMSGPRETLIYVTCVYNGNQIGTMDSRSDISSNIFSSSHQFSISIY